jgi:glyoxylase-like metal-dependent hydrolase (beta-lactamase superfamily II)
VDAAGGSTLKRIHAITGYISTLFVAEYTDTSSEGKNSSKFFLLDAGCRCDVPRLETLVDFLHDPSHLIHSGPSASPPPAGATDAAPSEGGNESTPAAAAISLMMATHAHPDHMGSASLLQQRHGTRVVSAPGVGDHHRGPIGLATWAAEMALAHFMAKLVGRPKLETTLFPPHLRPDFPDLQDGDALPSFASDWRGLYVPGHTQHMFALYHPAARILYAADLMMYNPRTRRCTPPTPVEFEDEYVATLRRLRDLPVDWLLLPHGGIVRMPAASSVAMPANATTVPTDADAAAGADLVYHEFIVDRAAAMGESDIAVANRPLSSSPPVDLQRHGAKARSRGGNTSYDFDLEARLQGTCTSLDAWPDLIERIAARVERTPHRNWFKLAATRALQGDSRNRTGVAQVRPGSVGDAAAAANSVRRVTLEHECGFQSEFPEILSHYAPTTYVQKFMFGGSK